MKNSISTRSPKVCFVLCTCLLWVLICSCTPAATTEQTSLTEAESLLQRKKAEGKSVWADGDTLTFVYEGEAETVELCCGLQEPLTRLPDSEAWVLRKTIPNLSEAVISYSFIVDGNFSESALDRVWRGTDAPPAPETLEPSAGSIFERTLNSKVLGETRKLVVYLPPDYAAQKPLGLPVVYLADGSSVWEFARFVEPLIRQGKLPQLLLIGIESGSYAGDPTAAYDPELDMRSREYIPRADDERFFEHERFVLDEVLPWAEEAFGASNDPAQRVVYGHSNGGVFAAAMGLRHPDVFGYALPFSVGVNPTDVIEVQAGTTEFYFIAGTLEERFYTTTRALS